MNTIAGLSQRHKLLSVEMIDANNVSSLTTYHYSKFEDAAKIKRIQQASTNTIIYDISGQKILKKQKGVNIVKKDGKTRKVLIK